MSAAGVTAAERPVDTTVESPTLAHLALICPHLLGLRERRFRMRCRWGGFRGAESDSQLLGGFGRWRRLVGLLRHLGSTRTGRFRPIARCEWCDSVRCTSANALYVREYSSKKFPKVSAGPCFPSSSGAVGTDVESISARLCASRAIEYQTST